MLFVTLGLLDFMRELFGMPVKRKYNVKGAKDFLVLAIIFFFVGLWAIKDAWFPSEKVLKKHPQEVQVSFETSGSIENIFVKVGDVVGKDRVLANFRTDRMLLEYDEAKATYTEKKTLFTKMEREAKSPEVQARLIAAQVAMDEALAGVTTLRVAIDSSELLSPVKGAIKEIQINTHSVVEAGQQVITLDPKDHFYLFNKSLAVFCFFSFLAFLAVHIRNS